MNFAAILSDTGHMVTAVTPSRDELTSGVQATLQRGRQAPGKTTWIGQGLAFQHAGLIEHQAGRIADRFSRIAASPSQRC